MKKIRLIPMLLASFLLVAMIACEGPEGPAGPAGTAGIDGVDGVDGHDGVDANSTCIECHDASTNIKAKQIQWAASGHGTGTTFERNTGECASCHTAEGFKTRLSTGEMDNGTMSNPTPHTCRSCHGIHEAYSDSSDYDLVVTEPFASIIDETVNFDLGKGNLCASCHQMRVPGDMSGDSTMVTSPYWGVHHGPQSNILSGFGAYAFGGTLSNTHTHQTITNACVNCHMAEAYGNQAGGHTWNMTYDYHGHEVLNDAGCTSCHDDAGTKFEELESEVQVKIDSCASLLLAKGLLAEDLGHAVPGTYTTDMAGALMNYLMIKEDRSMGAHNPTYVNAILDATITALQ